MPKPLPFTEEEMKQVFATNLIEYARSQGFEVEKADRKSCHVLEQGVLAHMRLVIACVSTHEERFRKAMGTKQKAEAKKELVAKRR